MEDHGGNPSRPSDGAEIVCLNRAINGEVRSKAKDALKESTLLEMQVIVR